MPMGFFYLVTIGSRLWSHESCWRTNLAKHKNVTFRGEEGAMKTPQKGPDCCTGLYRIVASADKANENDKPFFNGLLYLLGSFVFGLF